METQTSPQTFDREQAFLLYATFTGDIVRTAHALDVPEIAVLRVADEEGWQNRLGPILTMKKSSRPGDVERAINRAMNFVQAHQFRLFVDRVIRRVSGLDDTEFEDYLMCAHTVKGEVVRKLSTRALADLASAMEKAQALTYAALNDSAPERAKRATVDDDGAAASEMHAKIAAGMSAAGTSGSPRALLFDAQLAKAAAVVQDMEAKDKKPGNPYDSDEH